MTKKETIYNALGMIEGAVCVSQKNTREVLIKAIEMIKNAVEEDACKNVDCDCNHEWALKEYYECASTPFSKRCGKYVCLHCGAEEIRNI
jgi:hypothetical protein